MIAVRVTCDSTPRTAPVLVAILIGFVLSGCATPRHPSPRLAVVIVVDMLPADLLDRHEDLLSDGGFKRLIREGASFTNAHFSTVATLTGPGHATIATGAQPAQHGIVSNHWYEPGTGQPVDCVADAATQLIGSSFAGDITGASEHHLEVPTIGDQLKRHYGDDAKVWSCALKDRAAILMAGHNPDGAFWWSPDTGHFISSMRYSDKLPDWCQAFNDDKFADSFFEFTWDRALPIERYAGCDDDRSDYENAGRLVWPNTLPKKLGKPMYAPNRLYYERLRSSPFGNELVFELGRRAVIGDALGADDRPDLLMLSLSSNDYCGHRFGPHSHEVADLLVRTDRQIAEWLDFLDTRVGLDDCSIVLTSDHGTTPAPEYAIKKGLGGGRIDIDDLFATLNNAMRSKFGAVGDDVFYLKGIHLPWVYLNETSLAARKIDIAKASAVVAEEARKYPGIETAFAPGNSQSAGGESETLADAVADAVFAGRSGDVFVHLKRHWAVSYACSDHGTFHSYDTHVPLVFMGKAFNRGRHDAPVQMRDLAPTLSAVLGIDASPATTGRVLEEALAR